MSGGNEITQRAARSRWPLPAERFTKLYAIDAATGCWLWSGDTDSSGYGRIRSDGKQHKAHRFSHMLHVGPIPAGLSVCHKCDTPACVNPEHLFLASHAENMRDMAQKNRARPQGRQARHRSKWWTPASDEVLRALWGTMRSADIAERINPDLPREELLRRAREMGLPTPPKSLRYAWAAETRRRNADR